MPPPSQLAAVQQPPRGRLLDLATAVVLLGAALLFFSGLDVPLQEPDEVRYAEVPRQMLAAQSWLVPVLDGQPYLDKPPLHYWLVMASYRLCGVHDESARLVSCLSAFLVVVFTWLWARRCLGPRAALTAAAVLTLSARFVYLARLLTPDGLLCLWVVVSWMGLHLALSSDKIRWGWWLMSAAGCGLGVLTKGPVALALLLAPAAVWCWWERRRVPLRWLHVTVWLAAVLAIAGPWYLAVCFREPAFVEHFFWKHNLLRYVAPFNHSEPFWFYLPGLLAGTLPWSLLLPGLVQVLARRTRRARSRRPAALGFVLLTLAWCVLFFSCSGSKRAAYILPAFPPLSLALGWYLSLWLPPEICLQSGTEWWRTRSRLALRLAGIAVALGAAVALAAVPAGLVDLRPAAGVALGAAVMLLVLLRRRSRELSWPACGALVFAVLFLGARHLLPRYADRYSLRNDVQAPAQGEVAEVVCFPRRWDSVSYYLRRDDVRSYGTEQLEQMHADLLAHPETLVFLKPGDSFDLFVRSLPPALEFRQTSRHALMIAGWVRQKPLLGDFPQEYHLAARGR